MQRITRFLKDFRREESGSVVAEALITLPLLIWAFMAMFVYWDAFRSVNVSQKAAYNIADLLSRQAEVDNRFLDGMQSILTYMTPPEQNARIRMTSVQYIEADDRFIVLWSRSPGNAMPALNDITVESQDFKNRIPQMSDGHSVVIVETEMDYNPPFEAGLSERTLAEFVVTRPRFYLRICLVSGCPV
jgi:Flp pilus assembly protein TadG